VAIDLDDDTHSQRYTETVRVRHLVQRSSVQKRIARLEATHFADRFVLAARWDALFGRVKPLAGLEREREAHMAKRLRALTTEHERIVAVVPAPRFAGVVSRVATDGA
jgi:pheromone shutdown protein TraB